MTSPTALKRAWLFPCALTAVVLSLLAARRPGSSTVQDLYADALAKERAVRAALADEDAIPHDDSRRPARWWATSKRSCAAFRRAATATMRSGAPDSWPLDTFRKFGDEHEKAAAGTPAALPSLREYPTSKLGRPGARQAARPGRPSLPPSRTRPAARGRKRPTRLATIKDIRRTVLPDAVRVTIELDSEVAFHDERLGTSGACIRRSAVDPRVRGLRRSHDSLRGRWRRGATGSGRASSEQHDPRRPRRGRHLELQRVSALQPVPPRHRLHSREARAPGGRAPRLAPRRSAPRPLHRSCPAGAWLPTRPGRSRRSPPQRVQRCVTRATTRLRVLHSIDITPSAPLTTRPPTTNLAGGFSIARQLGLSVSRIVIDPGHGGHDPGAAGGGTTEAELVLDIALRLEKLLAKMPGVEVVLTRRTDDLRAASGAHRDREPRRRGSLSLDPRERQPQHAGPRRRNLLPQLRQQPERRSGRRARERGLRAADGRAAGSREGDRAQQQAR